ncbi:hypothetical protein SLS60_008087 [Paraconiothyrium brasiliense]|uniref:Major facilitator superfamily (MFS) profile domain-containing protein n=1 Tax=Paraconiothyrium brasiliense TaxID=300254 RepID=A0ABR3R3J2_9PLEO
MAVSPIEASTSTIHLPGNDSVSENTQPEAKWKSGTNTSLTTDSSASSTNMDLEKLDIPAEEWKPEKKEWIIMISLSIISLMVALDATILVTVLPVSCPY